MNSEKDVKKKVKAIFDRFGWFWWSPPANGYGKSGISDIHAIKSGIFVAVETKFGSNKPTPMQVGFLNSIRASGGTAFIVNEKNWEWLEAYCESLDIAGLAVRRKEPVPPEHGARMLNALSELSNKLLDTADAHASVIEATQENQLVQ